MSEISIEDQIRCVLRELELRKANYPKWIAAGKLKKHTAEREMGRLEAVLATLEAAQALRDARLARKPPENPKFELENP